MVNSNLTYHLNDEHITNIKVNETPLKWRFVSLSEVISSGKRIDATTFDMELMHVKTTLNNLKVECIPVVGENGFCSAYRPGICKRIFVEKSDNSIDMLTPSQITDLHPKAEKFLSINMTKNISNWFVKKGEILLTCSGTIGNLAYVSKTLDGKCVSQNLIRLVPKNVFDAGYLYALLKSKIGQLLLTRNNYGAVIQHIDPEHLQQILIPNASSEVKRKIHNLIVRSYELRDEANDMIDQAEKLLIYELQLPPINKFNVNSLKKDTTVNAFGVKLSQMSGRADASYHVPIVDAILKHLHNYAEEVTTIADNRISSEIILPGRFKRIYVEEGYGRVFIGGKQLCELDPSNKKYLSLTHHGDRISKQLELHENMTLITCSGTVGKVTMVGKQWENWTANQHIIRIVPANVDIAGYLNVFLSSDYGYHLITRFIYGSVVDEIDDNHVRQIAFPLLKNADVQKEINDLALEANQKRYEAYILEKEALKIVDDEVIYAK